jgi:secreted PhoX family phosphatase
MIAVDAAQTEWIPNDNSNSVSHVNSAGAALSSTAYTGGGLATPFGVAIDGAGRVWVTNNGPNGSVSELDTTGAPLSPSTGFASTSLSTPDGIAVDGSGNVWVTNQNNGVVTEFVGAATPVVTPLAAASLGTRP